MKLLDESLSEHGPPVSITFNSGTEFNSKALESWAWARGLKLDFRRAGKPMKNSYIERLNGRLRDEFLNVNQLLSLARARQKLKVWRRD